MSIAFSLFFAKLAITYFFLTQLVISADYFDLQGSVSDRA